MDHPTIDRLTTHANRLARIDVEQYHKMLAGGILHEGDPIELLDGLLVYKDRSTRGEDAMTIGKPHQVSVNLLAHLDRLAGPRGCYVQTQGAVTLPPNHEPEPDGAIVRGQPRDYLDRHPGPTDVFVVIEVADSSLHQDRTDKLRVYARAGIPQYVIVNLVDRCAEVFEQPVPGEGRYAQQRVLPADGTLPLLLPGGAPVETPVRGLLP